MRKVIVAGAALLLTVFASAAMAEIKVEGDVYVGVFDKYLWRGYDLSGSTTVVQGGMDLSAYNLTLSYWTNGQLNDDSHDFDPTSTLEGGDANETDITIDYALDLGELVTVNLGNYLYSVHGGEDTNEVYAAVTLNTLLSPKFAVYYDWDENKDARTYSLGIGHNLEFDQVTLTAGALANYMEGTDPYQLIETNVPWNAELSLSADVAVTEQITVTPSFVYSTPLSDDAQAIIDTEMASGLTVTLNF